MNRDFEDLIREFNANDGVAFTEAWPERLKTHFGEQPVSVLSRHHLIQNKRPAGRTQDLADVERLQDTREDAPHG